MTDLKERVLAAIAAEPSPTRAEAARNRLAILAAGALTSLCAWAAAGGVRPTGRPAALIVETALGAGLIGGIALALSLRRGPSMLGRSASVLLAIAILTPALLLAWKAWTSASFAGMTVPWPDRPGRRCLGVALATGAAPFAAFLLLWRRTQPAHPRLTGLALGTAAGAVSWFLVDLWCPVGNFNHLLLGHVLPIALFAAAGATAGTFLQARTR